MSRAQRVLVVTGGLVSHSETSFTQAARKLALQWRSSEAAWLDLKIKCVSAEPLVAAALERLKLPFEPEPQRGAVAGYLAGRETVDTPELTETLLTTLLAEHGVEYSIVSYADLFADPRARERLLAECGVVFASTTLLRDLSEVEPIVALLRRPHNRIVLGGALAGMLHREGEIAGIDVLAVGYGELLVAPLVDWMRGGFKELLAPARGRVERRGRQWVLYSGVPEGKDLDFLAAPDWARSARDRGRRYRLVHYESVRGCPYRCAFCNYPFLFDDTRFRYKSARKIYADWERYATELGVEHISCLDSLFTIPRQRLAELCGLLARRPLPVRWICYARADDMADASVARMMRDAGCSQVQIGLESGAQALLDNMNKRCTVENNLRAIENCRRVGITSVVSLIVGFPGETARTLEATYQHMAAARPDFYFLATFSTRVAGVPILQEPSRRRFSLRAASNARSVAPYWSHATMTCAEVGGHVRRLGRRLKENRISLDAAVFYGGILRFRPELRGPLLEFQRRLAERHPIATWIFDRLNSWIDRRLEADAARWLAAENLEDTVRAERDLGEERELIDTARGKPLMESVHG